MDRRKHHRLRALLAAALLGVAGAAAAAIDLASLVGGGEQRFLRPEQAFVLSVDAVPPATLRVHFDVAPGYYLYRDKLAFRAQGAGLSLGAPRLPAGHVKEDEYFGTVETYPEPFDVLLPVVGLAAPGEPAWLEVAYQGCAESGICYPPQRSRLPLTLTALAAGPASPGPPASAGGAAPVSDRSLAARLAGGGWLALAAFFGFGLLLAFTPCVLPMVPIVSALVVGQGSRLSPLRGAALGLAFVVSMSLAYALAGVAAGAAGANVQAAMQNPWVLGAFAALFVLLALAAFGLVEMQLPASLQSWASAASNRLRGGHLAGVAAMGALSALVVGPCVAPPLAGALLYIASTGDALLGGAALFVMGLGMGLPLVVASAAAGHWLPRAGPWMARAREITGFVLLGLAVWLLGRVLPGPVTVAAWALLAAMVGVALGALEPLADRGPGARLAKGLGVAALIGAGVLALGAGTGADDPLRPLARLGGAHQQAPALAFRPVSGADGLAAALAARDGRPVLLDVYADWCVECKRLERETFADPRVRQALAGYLLLRADVTAMTAADRALLAELELFGPPALVLYDASGRERRDARVIGYASADELLARLAASRLAGLP